MRKKKCKLAPHCLGNASMMHDEIILWQGFTSFILLLREKSDEIIIIISMKMSCKKLYAREKINFISKCLRGGGSGR